ncbi:MAG: hypothetical protein KAH01_08475 [Caldisericia bacterium]|nr:hypothetical protein [Caldisericia bacterium]
MKKFLMICFVISMVVVFFSGMQTSYAEPSDENSIVETLPDVTLPPVIQIPGTTSEKNKDGENLISANQLPDLDFSKPRNPNEQTSGDESELDMIEPPPIPMELFDIKNEKNEIDINSPIKTHSLPIDQKTPWYASLWFIMLSLLIFSGAIILIFRNTTINTELSDNETIISDKNSKKRKNK